MIFNKVKLDGPEKETPNQKNSSGFQMKNEDEGTKAWTPSGLRGRADPNLNAVKIEKLSDDEEVDITDETDELTSQVPQKDLSSVLLLDISNNKRPETIKAVVSDSQEDPISKSSKEYLQNIKQGEMEALSSSGIRLWTENYNTSDQK